MEERRIEEQQVWGKVGLEVLELRDIGEMGQRYSRYKGEQQVQRN